MCGYSRGRRLRVVGLSMVVLACGCNRERTTSTEPARTPTDSIERVARILVSQPPDGFTVGESAQLSAVVLSETNRVMAGQPVRWTSSDPSIATVSDVGVLHGERVGSATITASVGDKFGAVNVPVFSGACTQASVTIGIGETHVGALSSSGDCLFVLGEPSQGWQFSVTAPTLLQIDLSSDDYFAHFAITDTQLKTLATADRTLQIALPAGTYIVWVAADFDDASYTLSVKAVGP
jgi:Flp pilus assembly protein TadG